MAGNSTNSKDSSKIAQPSPPASPPASPPSLNPVPLDRDELDFSTLSIHADDHLENSSDVAPALHLSVTYKLNNCDNLVYSRSDHMTRRRVEKVLGALEGGFALTYASGLAAVSAAMFLLKPQVVYVDQKSGYFGCHEVMHVHQAFVNSYFSSSGSQGAMQFVPLEQLDKDVEQPNREALRRIVWLETPKNPTCSQEDVQLYASKAAKIGAQVVVDSTFGTPVLQQPLKHGAALVLHSTTKYLGGHSDALGGCLCTKDENMYRQLKRERSIIGNTMGVLESYLLLRSLRTLSLRVERQSQSAGIVAEWLASQINNPETGNKVAKVYYPTLKSLHPLDWDICQRQMGGKGPGILSFELDSQASVEPFLKKLKLVVYATSLGGHETLIDWRYRWDSNQPPALLRLSIGLESPLDIIADLRYALQSIGEDKKKKKK